jgi:ankyrin repeat protein
MRFNRLHKARGVVVAVLLGLGGCSSSEQAAVEPTAAEYQPTSLLQAVLVGHRAAATDFLAQGADVNATEPDGTTRLMRAVHGGFPEVARLLIDAGANVSAANRYGVTALYLAARSGDAATTRALLAAGASANTSLPEGESVLMTAAKAGNADIVRTLLTGGLAVALAVLATNSTADRVVTSGYSASAARAPSSPVNRANPNARERLYGQTALMWAAAEGHAEVARLLIEAGATVDEHSQNRNGQLTALHFAARAGQLDATRTLIEAGADLDAVDADGANALVLATLNGHLDVTGLLLEAGADPRVADRYGRTVLFVATDLNASNATARPAPQIASTFTPVDIIELALAKGADPDAALATGLPSGLAQVPEHNPILNEGATSFLRAAMSGDLKVMELLLEAGADPLTATAAREPVTVEGSEQPTNGRTTPLMAAAGVGWRESISVGREADAIQALQLLLDRGADVNAANQSGDTALHGATLRGSTAIIEFLVEHGANVRARNANGRTALDIAMGVPDDRIPYNEATAKLLRRLTPRS